MSKKVALHCGHGKSINGSWDSGCAYGKYTEAGLMLPITKAAVKYLRSYGVTVISDADKGNNRNMISDVRWANDEDVDIYVSVHCDYSKAPSGVMPLYVSSGGKKLATALNNAVKSGLKMKSRGVVRRTDLWELNGTDMVACILETGAIKADLATLRDKADAYGKAIAKGICDYLGVKASVKETNKTSASSTKKTETLYRVRKSWGDVSSQAGAFFDIENAKKLADIKGLNVYDATGKLVYTGKKKVVKKKSAAKKTTKPAPTPTPGANKIVARAKEYCWPYGTAKKNWKYKTGHALKAYKAALKKYMNKTAKISQSDCGYFVSTCVRAAGVSKTFQALKGTHQSFAPVPSSMRLVWAGKKIPDNFLKPGDVVRYKKKSGQHTLLIMPGGKIAEGQRGTGFPCIKKDVKKYNKSNVKTSTLQVLRAK